MSLPGFLMLIILLGAIQGFIIGLLLFFSQPHRLSNRLLAILLLLMSLASLNFYLDGTGIYYSNSGLAMFHALVPMVIVMPMGPLIFFYIRSSLDPSFRIGRKQAIHFLPALIDLGPQL